MATEKEGKYISDFEEQFYIEDDDYILIEKFGYPGRYNRISLREVKALIETKTERNYTNFTGIVSSIESDNDRRVRELERKIDHVYSIVIFLYRRMYHLEVAINEARNRAFRVIEQILQKL
jgi:hypothetical protein